MSLSTIWWQDKLPHSDTQAFKELRIPFTKNTVNLPFQMSRDKENALSLLKSEILKVSQQEIQATRKHSQVKKIQNQVRRTRNFLNANNLSVVASDKTNKLVITNSENLDKRIENLLSDVGTYKKLKNQRRNL